MVERSSASLEQLVRLFEPRSIAVVGASDDRGKFGGRIIQNLVRHGFHGDLIPINPGRAQVLGRPCFPRVSEVGRSIDVAILAVPPLAVLPSVRDCAESGVGNCVIVTTGFAEADIKGAAIQAQLVNIARSSGMRLVGPNCMGFMDFRGRVALTSAVALGSLPLVDGPVALVTQSGGLMTSMFAWAVEQGIGLSFCASTGNETDVDLSDVLEYLSHRQDCRVICVYAERIGHPLRFLRAARRCVDAGIGVLLLKSGRTESGAVAAKSHTASIVGSFDVIAINCESVGIVLADDPKAMVHAASLHARYGALVSHGSSARMTKVGVISGSGGALTILADRLTEAGLPLATISRARPAIVGRSAGFLAGPALFDTGRRDSSMNERSAAIELIRYLLASTSVAGVVVALTGGAGSDELVDALVECSPAAKKPILCGAVLGGVTPELKAAVSGRLPLFDTVDEIVRVMELWTQLRVAVKNTSKGKRGPESATLRAYSEGRPRKRSHRILVDRLRKAGDSPFALTELKILVRDLGLPANASFPARSEEEAVERASELGYPVALKISSRAIVHKQQIGGVALGLDNGFQVREAWKRIVERAKSEGVEIEGCTVEPMAHGDIELLLGVRWDDDWPGVVLIAEGGVSTALERERRWLSAPSTRQLSNIETSIRALPSWKRGFVGRSALIEQRCARSVATVAQRLGRLASDLTGLDKHGFVLEVNPILVSIESGEATILDVHLVTGEGS
jgi:acyl-CoA synthetase (NDP forming)